MRVVYLLTRARLVEGGESLAGSEVPSSLTVSQCLKLRHQTGLTPSSLPPPPLDQLSSPCLLQVRRNIFPVDILEEELGGGVPPSSS